MEGNNKIIPIQQNNLISRVSDSLNITEKILELNNHQLIPYRKGSKWGFCTPDKKIVIDCIYEITFQFFNNRAKVRLDNKYGLIDKSGKYIVEMIYDEIYLSDNYYKVIKDNKFGLLDINGKIILDLIYDDLQYFYDGLASAKLNGKYGFINKKGNIVIDFIYDYIEHFSEGLSYVKAGRKYGFIDVNGNFIIEIEHCTFVNEYDSFQNKFHLSPQKFSHGYCNVCIDLGNLKFKYIFINKNGDMLKMDNHYGMIKPFSENRSAVCKNFDGINNLWGFIDIHGNEIIECKYDDVSSFKEGLACVKLNDKWGYINYNGDLIIPFIYDKAMPFSEGMAAVGNNIHINSSQYSLFWGYINKYNELILPFKYDSFFTYEEHISYAKNFNNGNAVVKRDNKYGIVNDMGKEVIPLIYGNISNIIDGLVSVYLTNGSRIPLGYISENGICYWED